MKSKVLKRISSLDGLRGFAIFLVLIHHYIVNQLNAPIGSLLAYIKASLHLTWAGVDIFFVISGFLIGKILMEHPISIRMVKTFYIRRSARILPVFLCFMIISLFVIELNIIPSSYHLLPWWSYWTFTVNIGYAFLDSWDWGPLSVLWSLCVEEQFYLFAPVIFFFTSSKFIPTLLGVLWIITYISRLSIELFSGNTLMTELLPICRGEGIIFGMGIAWLSVHGYLHALATRYSKVMSIAIIICSLILLVITLQGPKNGHFLLVAGGYTSISILTSIIIIWLVTEAKPLVTYFFKMPLLIKFGQISYCLYLFHMLSFYLIQYAFTLHLPEFYYTNCLIISVPALILCFSFSCLSLKFLEKPFLGLARHWSYQ